MRTALELYHTIASAGLRLHAAGIRFTAFCQQNLKLWIIRWLLPLVKVDIPAYRSPGIHLAWLAVVLI
ncbi:MAG: hypothetical protein M1336_02655 [Deltaproteobacteria bacterium]|nr:hypothetical protein [Deltaproteobacteria bacterium]